MLKIPFETPTSFTVQAHNVARKLNVPVRTVRYWAKRGIIPAVKRGLKIWYFPVDYEQRFRSCPLFMRRYDWEKERRPDHPNRGNHSSE
jgi:hypothetical protein